MAEKDERVFVSPAESIEAEEDCEWQTCVEYGEFRFQFVVVSVEGDVLEYHTY